MDKREIKFKCWIPESKKMLVLESTTENHNHYLQTGSGGFWLYASVNGALMANSEAGDILLQFTGLYDKNETPIYEGDIVRILYTDWPSKTSSDTRTLDQYLTDIAHIATVMFLEDRWCVGKYDEQWKQWDTNSIMPGKHGYIEVIGNIYEHPNLLETTPPPITNK